MKAILNLNFWCNNELLLKTTKEFFVIDSGDKDIDRLKLKELVMSTTTNLMVNWNGYISYHCTLIETKQLESWSVGKEVRL